MWLAKKIAVFPLLVGILMTAGCGSLGSHRVKQGETLYSISWRYGLDYREVAAWNRLNAPYVIHEGQILQIAPPAGLAQSADVPVRSVPVPPIVHGTTATPAPRAKSGSTASIQWQWPVRGALLQTFSDTDMNRKGIDIAGQSGQSVHAAATGQVVYAGSGLLNYGKLIILKHDDNYLSAYAYNRKLRVTEGDAVVIGQHIADMGSKAGGGAMLHFEIRYDGRPINPINYLPADRQ